ncbi:MAG: CcmD family protein [Spirochaetes bacterium]|nr:CcmD family protein [Spirochaetota bacterium]
MARAQTGAVVSSGENLKITVTPVRKDEGAVPSAVLYRVLGVVLIIWAGLAAYLFIIDRRVARIEKEIHLTE